MGGYEVLDHTSDVGVVARGGSIEETLSLLCLGAFSIAYDLEGVAVLEQWTVSADGRDLVEATIRILNEALFLHETERALFSSVSVRVTYGNAVSLEARLGGETFDPGRHRLLRQVKAATYHMASVKPREAMVILDV